MDKIYYDSIDETVYHKVLDNGLDVHILKKEGFHTKCAFFATRFGSFNTGDTLLDENNTKLIGGLAHFLEHRMFDYKDGNVIDLYYKLGADCNAFTSYDRTVYYFNGEDNFEECLKLLLDFPTSFTMSKEAVEKEKDIIISELLMYKDDPDDKLFKATLSGLYKNHPIKDDVGGRVDEVKSTTYDLLKKVHSTFYSPKNMVLVVAGDVDVDATMKIIESKKFEDATIKFEKNHPSETKDIVRKETIVTGDVNGTKLLLGYKFKPLDGLSSSESMKIFMSLDMLNTLLFSRSSEFYKRLIEEKKVSSLSYDIMQFDGVFTTLIEATPLEDEKEVVNEIISRVDESLNLINEDRLNSIKKKQIANIIKGSDNPVSLGRNYLNCLLDDGNYLNMMNLIKSITTDDLIRVYKEYYLDAPYGYGVIKKDQFEK